MNGVLLSARVVLAGVFVVAGLAKLADLPGSRRALREFGVPALFAPLLGSLLPVGELAVAVALIIRGSARWGAVAALLLLVMFAVAIGAAMVRGRQPDCHCFGQLHSAPAGWRTLLRNGMLAAVAGFVAIAGWTDAGASATGSLARLSALALAGLGVGLLVVVSQAVFSWLLLRQNGRLMARLDAVEARLGNEPAAAPRGLSAGSLAPSFAVPSVDAGTVALEHLLGYGRAVALVFSDPGCGPCTALMPKIGEWQRHHGNRITVAVVSRGSSDAHRAIVSEHRIRHVGLQLDREVAEAYAVPGTPAAVLIDPDGRIAGALAVGREAVAKLVDDRLSLAFAASAIDDQPVRSLRAFGQ